LIYTLLATFFPIYQKIQKICFFEKFYFKKLTLILID
jgi:hypothetical protein